MAFAANQTLNPISPATPNGANLTGAPEGLTASARLRVVAELASGGLLAVARECLRGTPRGEPKVTLTPLVVCASSVTSLNEAHLSHPKDLGLVIALVREVAEGYAAQLPKRTGRALAMCVESAEGAAKALEGAQQTSVQQVSSVDAQATDNAARLIEHLLHLPVRQAAVGLSLTRTMPKTKANRVWESVGILLLASVEISGAIEDAVRSGATSRDEIVQQAERSLRSKSGFASTQMLSEIMSKLRSVGA